MASCGRKQGVTAVLAPPATTDVLARYEMDDPFRIRRFLDWNPNLLSLLEEALHPIERCFGASASLRLSLFEPADSPGDPELFVRIAAPGDLEDAARKLERLDREWWLDASTRGRCRMNIDVEPA